MLRGTVEQRVLDAYAPAHVVVDGDGQVVHYSAHTGKYFGMPSGTPTTQLVAAARRGLRFGLESALREAAQSGRTVVKTRVALDREADGEAVRLVVEPLPQQGGGILFLVVLYDLERAGDRLAKLRGADLVGELEHELAEARGRLQSTVEEYESALEALRASNEELLCVNEEARASQEEVDLSNEELQSVNEELNTLNRQLHEKVAELDGANSDLRNLLDSAQVATVFLDGELLIRNYTGAATAIFRLLPGDCGRPLADIAHRLEIGELPQDLETVLATGAPIERRVRGTEGTGYLMRLAPYRNDNGAVDGVVVSFIDLTSAG